MQKIREGTNHIVRHATCMCRNELSNYGTLVLQDFGGASNSYTSLRIEPALCWTVAVLAFILYCKDCCCYRCLCAYMQASFGRTAAVKKEQKQQKPVVGGKQLRKRPAVALAWLPS